ncbi:hypothetical protein [Streptomyces sp. CBMA152]|uniref:hypothetical protein n=1 Tax=Streptomyces sp. CBMA152 TaxID=1896312 RepID=UPI00166011E1|nr:hypothetical protein [Streptomyces sp. CBMA152]
MKTTKGITASILVLAMAAAGCSKAVDVPGEFCGVTVSKQSLSPLLPHSGNLKEEEFDLPSHPGATCGINIGGTRILTGTVQYFDRAPEPVDWNRVASRYKQGRKRQLLFPGEGVIGSRSASIEAKCTSAAAYVDVTVHFNGSRVDDSPEGYKKLQRFIEDFVPSATKKYGCTK